MEREKPYGRVAETGTVGAWQAPPLWPSQGSSQAEGQGVPKGGGCGKWGRAPPESDREPPFGPCRDIFLSSRLCMGP